jgi:DUF1680 family protein
MVWLRLLSGQCDTFHGKCSSISICITEGSDIFVNLYIQGKGNVNGTELLQHTDYPWNGNVKITVNPKKNANFNIRLRIPSWAKSRPVATNLYNFADSAKQYTCKCKR